MDRRLLRALCSAAGVSGDEGRVRDYIIDRLLPLGYPMEVDNIGNLTVSVTGRRRAGQRVMVCAHMDEVGLIIKSVDDNGFLRFETVGGIDPRVLPSKRVKVGDRGVTGVIGIAAIHLIKRGERRKAPPVEKLYIDIGAKDRDDALKAVNTGDYAAFEPDFSAMGGFIRSKALDDRVGAAAMIELIERGVEYDADFVFTVQEEVGLRGAAIAARRIEPDIAVVMETTTAADFPGVDVKSRITKAGGGVAISVMDRSTIYDRELVRLAVDTARRKGLAFQIKQGTAGGNDAGAIQRAALPVRMLALSVPCRGLHAPSSACSVRDIDAQRELCGALLEVIGGMKNA